VGAVGEHQRHVAATLDDDVLSGSNNDDDSADHSGRSA
jgi:hypothetical protein